MIVRQSASSFDATVGSLIQAIERRELKLFARIDHAAAARDVGMELEDEQVCLFGSPRGGTPLMQSDRQVGIELPLRMLVWSEHDGVRVGYRDPRELSGEYDLAEQQGALEQMAGLLAALAEEAAGQ